YRLAEPKSFPAGTKIRCVAHFDNSAGNLNNPDPSKTVRWGAQTWDEMLLGYFDIAQPVKPGTKADQSLARARQVLERFDTDGDDIVRREEVAERVRPVFDRLDLQGHGELTLDDLGKVIDLLPKK